MACPYFVPREIVYDIAWPHPARLPLGAGWTGSCCAAGPDESVATPIDVSYVRDFCNLGYASACPYLPATREWDAIRFSVAGASAGQITFTYICERNHAPAAHGTMTYDFAAEAWRDAHPDPRVLRLAASYLRAYRARQSSTVA